MRGLILTAMVLLLALPADAQRRDLPVPADKGWMHADSGIVLTASLDGLPRTSLTDYGTAERDIAAEFAAPDRTTVATVYIFRPALMSVPLWFDRAQTTLELRQTYGGVTPVAAAPVAFAPPGASAPSALRQIYMPRRGQYRSTALAVVPRGEWLVAIRLSSMVTDPAAIDGKMSRIMAAVRWGKADDTSIAATPISLCPDGLVFRKAKLKKPDMMQALLGGAIAATAMKQDGPRTPVVWCRDPSAPTAEYGIYRAAGSTDGYTVAIADSGRIAAVTLPNVLGTGGYAISYTDLDGTVATFPSFDRLPNPGQVVALVLGGNVIARTGMGGKDVTIAVPPSK